MDKHEIHDLILCGKEGRNIEFRGSVNWQEAETRESLTKSILAMAHVPDGGVIILGMERGKEGFKPVGIKQKDKASFGQKSLQSFINEYADPKIIVRLSRVTIEGSVFLIIRVPEFQEVPILCVKDGTAGLKRGALYMRNGSANETHEVTTAEEMRAILNRATEKAVRAVRLRIYQENIKITKPGAKLEKPETDDYELPARPVALTEEDRRKFEQQMQSIDSADRRIEKIFMTGYWRVVIRPTRFDPKRIPSTRRLREVIQRCIVTVRGSGYPQMDPKETSEKYDWVQSGHDFMSLVHRWRYFQSGQFVHYIACREDYEVDVRNLANLHIPGPYPSGRYLDAVSALYRITEIFEFAARLTYSGLLHPSAEISVEVFGTGERQLFCWDPVWGFNEICLCDQPEIKVSRIYREDELLNYAPRMALECTMGLIEFFNGKAIPRRMLMQKQKQFLEMET